MAKISKKLRIKWNFELTVFELTVPDLYMVEKPYSYYFCLVFPELPFSFYATFFSKIALHVFLNFICSHSLSLIYIGLHMKFV